MDDEVSIGEVVVSDVVVDDDADDASTESQLLSMKYLNASRSALILSSNVITTSASLTVETTLLSSISATFGFLESEVLFAASSRRRDFSSSAIPVVILSNYDFFRMNK